MMGTLTTRLRTLGEVRYDLRRFALPVDDEDMHTLGAQEDMAYIDSLVALVIKDNDHANDLYMWVYGVGIYHFSTSQIDAFYKWLTHGGEYPANTQGRQLNPYSVGFQKSLENAPKELLNDVVLRENGFRELVEWYRTYKEQHSYENVRD